MGMVLPCRVALHAIEFFLFMSCATLIVVLYLTFVIVFIILLVANVA